MICGECAGGDHGRCDDVQRQERYLAWLADHGGRPPPAVAPTCGCPCLHRVNDEEGAVA